MVMCVRVARIPSRSLHILQHRNAKVMDMRDAGPHLGGFHGFLVADPPHDFNPIPARWDRYLIRAARIEIVAHAAPCALRHGLDGMLGEVSLVAGRVDDPDLGGHRLAGGCVEQRASNDSWSSRVWTLPVKDSGREQQASGREHGYRTQDLPA